MHHDEIHLCRRTASNMAIAALCRETPLVTNSFVQHCQQMGIFQIFLYLDDSDDRSIFKIPEHPTLKIHRCSDAFWKRVNPGKGRPNTVEHRQRLCFNDAYKQLPPGGWIGFCDADEIFVPHSSLDQTLSAVPDEVEQVLAPTWEGLWDMKDSPDIQWSASYARGAVWTSEALNHCTGSTSYLFRSLQSHGLVGHASGKCIVRTGYKNFSAGNHWHFKIEDGNRVKLTIAEANIDLLHFDAISFTDWKNKHQNRAQGKTITGAKMDKRRAQTEAFSLCETESSQRRLFWSFYGSTPEYREALSKHGALKRIVR